MNIIQIRDDVSDELVMTLAVNEQINIPQEFEEYKAKYPEDWTLDDGFYQYLVVKHPSLTDVNKVEIEEVLL